MRSRQAARHSRLVGIRGSFVFGAKVATYSVATPTGQVGLRFSVLSTERMTDPVVAAWDRMNEDTEFCEQLELSLPEPPHESPLETPTPAALQTMCAVSRA